MTRTGSGDTGRANQDIKVRLYILGGNATSQRAIDNLKALAEMATGNNFQYEIIDIKVEPEMAEADNIIAAPTLIKFSPPPVIRMLGDLSDMERVSTLLSLDEDSN